MILHLILVISILLQLAAAVYALRLIKVTGFRFSWIFISLSMLLMVVRRLIALYNNYTMNNIASLPNELIGLILSMTMLIGVYLIRPVFLEIKESEKNIKKLLSEKDILIRELYHRTKNTMQVIRALIMLQAAEYSSNEEIQKLVKITNSRIEAMSLVHQKLYCSKNLSRISIKEYIEELTGLIINQFIAGKGSDISLTISVDEDHHFILDTAIPLGLILNELITNSLKHGFPDQKDGSITIKLGRSLPDKYKLVYVDNGVGFPEGFDFRSSNTLGLTLIQQIGEVQLLGTVELYSDSGVCCSIVFPDNLYRARV